MEHLDVQRNQPRQRQKVEIRFPELKNWTLCLGCLEWTMCIYKRLERTEWRVSTAARMWERQRKVDLGQTEKKILRFKNEKKQKAQLLAERSVEGSSRLGLVRVSWKNADFCCAGSAAMAPSSMLSTYVAKKDFLVTVPILCLPSLLMSAMSSPLPAWACAVKLPGFAAKEKYKHMGWRCTIQPLTVQTKREDSIWFDMIHGIFMPHVSPCPVVSRGQRQGTHCTFSGSNCQAANTAVCTNQIVQMRRVEWHAQNVKASPRVWSSP